MNRPNCVEEFKERLNNHQFKTCALDDIRLGKELKLNQFIIDSPVAHRRLVYYSCISDRPYGSTYFLPLELCSTQYVSLEYTLNTPLIRKPQT